MTVSADFGAALSSALGQVAGATRSCTFALPSAASGAGLDLGKVNVTLTSNAGTTGLVNASSAAACRQGWQYDSSGTHIVLCPDTCASLRANPSLEVRVVLGCATAHG